MVKVNVNWNHVLIAGFGGLICGRAIKFSRENPDVSRPLLYYSTAISGVGVALGVGVAAYRKVPIHIYAVGVGANFALCSLTFFGVRYEIMKLLHVPRPHPLTEADGVVQDSSQLLPWHKYIGSMVSGGVVGGVASIVSRQGTRVVMATALGGMLVGLVGQWNYNQFKKWRIKKGLLLQYPDLVPPPTRDWSLNTLQTHFLDFWHQRSKFSIVESEIIVLEKDIAQEREMLAALNAELAELYAEDPNRAVTSSTSEVNNN